MSRAGSADYFYSASDPFRRDQWFRERNAREYMHHPFHAMNEQLTHPTMKGMTTTTLELTSQPWRLMGAARTEDGSTHCIDERSASRPASQRMETREGWKIASGGEPLDRCRHASTRTRRLQASSSSGALPMGRRLAATAGRLGEDSALGDCDSVRSSVASSGCLLARRQPSRFRPDRHVAKTCGYDTSGPGGAGTPAFAPLCGNADPRTRMPTFARIYGC
eukprot:TRINITY_DN15083_c6_g1_i1.p1 TRINITY_DN15083_c6_g1~~TRINITY_DN15083_c6_g1_i1.p1  ORF type:complete len:221 (+),score=26.53 TRINITY_DN15083_c6_g1_i1:116-778(+)